MRSLRHPLCSWCGNEYKRGRARGGAPLCPNCRVQLNNAPTGVLVEIIAQLAAYNHVALRLLAEGHEVIEQVKPAKQHNKSGGRPPNADGAERSVA
jgi:hypothetical protein